MFIGFFKSNNASSFIFLPFIAIAIWVFGFTAPSVLPVKYTMPLYELIAGVFAPVPWLSTLMALLLVIGEAFLLNYIVTENEVLTKQSYLPALIYIVFMSNNNDLLMLHPVLFANLFLLFAVNKLLSSYRKDIAFSQVFDAGFLASIATLFYFPSVVLLPLLGVGLILLRPFIWREWVISILGVILPYLFVITFYFWNDTLNYLWCDKLLFPLLQGKSKPEFSQSLYFMIAVSSLIVLFSLAKVFGGLTSGAQKTKKGIVLMIWFFIFSGLSLLIAPQFSIRYFSLIAIPASVFCAHFLGNVKRQWLAEVLFLLLIGSALVNLIGYYL